jgi:ribA/ribD-fused uncharacterized protein
MSSLKRKKPAAETAAAAAAPAAASSQDSDLAVWKELPRELPCALFYLSEAQAPVLTDYEELTEYVEHLPCWVSQAHLARVLIGTDDLIRKTERVRGPWVWAPEFSNVHSTWLFDEPAIEVDEKMFAGGPEVYFQLAKYKNTNSYAKALKELTANPNPMNAWKVGQKWTSRSDWMGVRTETMRRATEAKFTQHAELGALLKATRKHTLCQIKPDDSFWGSGDDGAGVDMLGVLLMGIRANL